jgi:hypothetical protein
MIGTVTFSYIPIVHAESNQQVVTSVEAKENQLSKLEIEGISLEQAFSAEVNTYSATVENETKSIQLKMETNESDT